MNINQALIYKSFEITGRGIVAEIQHFKEGLPKGTVLKSLLTGEKWAVNQRVLLNFFINNHILFDNEEITYSYFTFKSVEMFEQAKKEALERELANIFQYYLKPMNHEGKPLENDILDILD